ncbi:unnamed protein product [Clavelina lepadiformis]|uniref:Survivin n=1 Tax=Clavelina lepadiformis TaxID=159417 RepID=A0ABP0GEN0_CLALP
MSVDQASMFLYTNRFKTFDGWPYTKDDGAKCTAEKLSHSGFFRPNPDSDPDLVRCFVCHKDLEGWEPNDEPESEHKSHSSKCPFLKLKNRNMNDMKMKDFVKLRYNEAIYLISVSGKKAVDDLKHDTKKSLGEFEKQAP